MERVREVGGAAAERRDALAALSKLGLLLCGATRDGGVAARLVGGGIAGQYPGDEGIADGELPRFFVELREAIGVRAALDRRSEGRTDAARGARRFRLVLRRRRPAGNGNEQERRWEGHEHPETR